MATLDFYSNDFVNNLQKLTDDELNTLNNYVSHEKTRRAEQARIELINNFRNAFLAIHKAGIEIAIDNYNYDEEFTITRFDDFNFY